MLAGFAVANGRNDTDLIDAHEGITRTLMEYKPPATRIDYEDRRDPISGDKYEGGFVNVAGDAPDEEKQDYLLATAALGIPFFALMIVFIAFYLIFALVRFVCCCCGRGCCPRPRDEGYSKKHRFIVRLVITAFTVATFVGAILLFVSAAEIPKSLGTGSSGLVGVTVDTLGDMIDIAANLADNIGSAADTINTQIDRLASAINKVSGGALQVPSASLKALATEAKNATLDFKQTTDQSKNDLQASVTDVDAYMESVELALTVASAVMGAFALIFLVFAWFGWKMLMAIAFILTPLFVTICFILAGFGIIISTFLSDICFELDVMVDLFKTQGADAASQSDIAAGLLPCLDEQAVSDVLKPVLQFGNTCAFLAQYGQVGDGISAISAAKAAQAPGNFKLSDLPSSGIYKAGPGFRYTSDCKLNLAADSPGFNAQCSEPSGKTDDAAYRAAVGFDTGNPARGIEGILNNDPQFDNEGNVYVYPSRKWEEVFGKELVTETEAKTVTAGLAASDGWHYVDANDGNKKAFQLSTEAFFKVVGDIEKAIGAPNEAIGSAGGLEFLGRCGHIQLLGDRLANDVCTDMDTAFMLFYQGFAVMGCGYVLCSIAYLFGIQRLGQDAVSEEDKEFTM